MSLAICPSSSLCGTLSWIGWSGRLLTGRREQPSEPALVLLVAQPAETGSLQLLDRTIRQTNEEVVGRVEPADDLHLLPLGQARGLPLPRQVALDRGRGVGRQLRGRLFAHLRTNEG